MSRRSRSKKPSKKEEDEEGPCNIQIQTSEHYPFDEVFLRRYFVLLTMLLDRDYSGDGLGEITPLDIDFETDDEDVEEGERAVARLRGREPQR